MIVASLALNRVASIVAACFAAGVRPTVVRVSRPEVDAICAELGFADGREPIAFPLEYWDAARCRSVCVTVTTGRRA